MRTLQERLEVGAAYLRTVGPFYGMFGLALSLYFASQGAGWLSWPLLGTVARLAVAALAGRFALRWTGELSHVFLAQSLGLIASGFINVRRRRGRFGSLMAVVHGSRATKEIVNMSGTYSLVSLIGLLPFVLAACNDATSSSTDPRMQPPLVRIETVKISVQSERSFTGIVAARVQSDLGFRVPGKVVERVVEVGQTVNRGQPLMRIDPTDLRLAMRAHEEAVAAAKARARQTADDEARHRDLVPVGAVSASAYDKATAAAEAARAELSAAEARADVARNEAGYAVLLADADGVVVETLAEPGHVVGAGQGVVRVAHAGRREAVIELPETLRPAIGSTGRATLYGSELTGPATLRQLSDAANRQTRTFEARYVLEGRLADAPLGSTISIQISDGRSAPALQVPIGAIFDPGKGPGVWLVDGETLRVTWRAVHIAGLSGEAASVVGNLKAGDRVVALGAHLLHEGEHVRLAESKAAPNVAAKRGDSQ